MSIELPVFNPTLTELRCIVLFGIAWLGCVFCHYRMWRIAKEADARKEDSFGWYFFWFLTFLGGFGFLTGFIYNLIGAFWPGGDA